MRIGKVIGSVHATRKVQSLTGYRLLILEVLGNELKPTGEKLIAVDTIDAGPGDVVYFVEARDATLALKHELTPSDATIVGLVEDFE